MKKITSAGPSITNSEVENVLDTIKNGWHQNMSKHIDQFTEDFSSYIGVSYCLPTAHCTDAIHLAMLALNIGPGDEVIVPDLTWVASASPIVFVGATPVFADVDPISWCITADSIKEKITPKTKAVIVVDLLGNIAEWNEIKALCINKGIRMIEDSAQALGSKYHGASAGSFGDISVFSFSPTKMITAGQGGAFCTNDEMLYSRAKLFYHHGMDADISGKYYWSNILGYNYQWTNLQAALAHSQLKRIDELIEYKIWLFNEYKKNLSQVDGILLNTPSENIDSSYWITTVIVDEKYKLFKENIIESFSKFYIDVRPLFYPISAMPPFQEFVNDNMRSINPVAYSLSDKGICLPSGNNLNKLDVEKICKVFKNILMH